MPTAADGYDVRYADKLWELIPPLYRELDSDDEAVKGPLREMVDRIGGQAAILRRASDRLWDDQSIESCDDWLIPYIGDLLATNLVSSLDARGRRLDVANTIYYRRRAGTVGVLEEIAHDITGWDARVVEFFRRLARTRHSLDPEIGLPANTDDPIGFAALQAAEGLVGSRTRTQIGGYADLRNVYGAQEAHTAFDEFFHTADFRAGRGATGWYAIPGLGAFVWRLYSFGVVKATPVACATAGLFAFDPTGRRIPLFAASSRTKADSYGNHWVSPLEWQLPTPIRTALYEAEQAHLYPGSLQVFTRAGINYVDVPAAKVTVHPEIGTFRLTNDLLGQTVAASYHYGFPSTLGAGPYDRRILGQALSPLFSPETHVVDGGVLPALPATGTVTIDDSLTYTPGAAAGLQSTTLRAANRLRPLVEMQVGQPWTFNAAGGTELYLEGIWLSGADLVLSGSFDIVRLTCITTDPGNSGESLQPPAVFESSVSGRKLAPTRLWVDGSVRLLEADRCLLGPIRTRGHGSVEKLLLADSIVQGLRTEDFGNFLALKDADRLAARLKAANDPVSQWLWSQLTGPTQGAVTSYLANGNPPLTQVEADLATDLNALIGGPLIYTAGRFAGVQLDAATLAAAQAPPPPGPGLVRLNRELLEEAFPADLADLALSLPAGSAELVRCTILGPAYLHRLEASECILDDRVLVEDTQHGCVRFTAWSTGSVLPQQYESVEIAAGAPIFTSRQFGQPGYAQLRTDADRAIITGPPRASVTEGGPTGSEMGAYAREMNAIKRRSLLIKFQEFMPLGMSPVVVEVT